MSGLHDNPGSPPERLLFLDALRGVAAIVVVFVHLWANSSAFFRLPGWAGREISFGATGVLLFFVISGFSLDMTTSRHLARSRPILSYGMSRFFRIAPLMYFMIPVTAIRDKLVWHHLDYGVFSSLLNVTFLFNLAPKHQLGIVWASWTIGVEVIFYAVFPIIYRLPIWVSAVGTMIGYLALAIIIHPEQVGTFAWCFFPGFLPLFVIGMASHRIFIRLRAQGSRLGPPLLWVSIAALIVCSIVPNSTTDVFMRLPIALAYAGLIIGCGLSPLRLLVNRWAAFYGCISYAVYLLHFPLIVAMAPLLRATLYRLPGTVAYLAAAGFTFLALTPLAYLAFAAIERPADRWGRTFYKRITADRPLRSGQLSRGAPV